MFSIIKNIARHSVIYGAADLFNRAAGFVLIPLYTYYLTTADYGTLELLDLTSYIVSMFLGMGISQAVFRFYYEFDEIKKKHQVLSVSLITSWVVSCTVLTGLIYFSKEISTLVFETPDNFVLFNIIFVTVVVQLSNKIPLAFLRIEEKSILFVSINFIMLIVNLSLNILFIVHYGMGIKGILLGGLIVTVLTGVFLLVYIFRRIKLSYSFKLLFSMLRYCLPLMWTWVGMFILHFGDRFIIQRLASLSDLGIYSLAYKFGFVTSILVLNPFNMIWEPKRFELVKEPNAKQIYSVIFTYYMYFLIFISLGIAVLIKDIITIMADPEYHSAFQYVAVILLAYVARGAFTFLEFGIHLKKKTKYLAYVSLFGAVINLGLNFLLIPKIGVWGAALATLMSFLIMLVFIYVISQRLYYIPFDFGRLGKMTVVAAVLYIIAHFATPSHIAISLSAKFLIAASFPFVLHLVNFYQPNELARIAKGRKQIVNIAKSGTGSCLRKMVGWVRRKSM